MAIYVQFSDETESKIIAAFSSPQTPADYENYAEIDDSDERYIAFVASLETLVG